MSLAETIISNGSAFARRSGSGSPLMWAFFGDQYIGAAHGVFGIIHMLLHVDAVVRQSSHRRLLVATLDWLLSIRTSRGNWPAVCGEGSDHLVHFCHGAPGAVLTLCKAYEVLGESRFLKAAVDAGEFVWRYGLLRKGPGLCHGIAGNGYVFLTLFRTTNDSQWLARAYHFASTMLRDDIVRASQIPDNPLSLFEGLAGTACFLLDLRLAPEAATFPLFEVGGFSLAAAEGDGSAVSVVPAATSQRRAESETELSLCKAHDWIMIPTASWHN